MRELNKVNRKLKSFLGRDEGDIKRLFNIYIRKVWYGTISFFSIFLSKNYIVSK